MNSRRRNRKIAIERFTATQNDYGEEVPTWSQLGTAWAEVKFGSGREKREAAQEAASQAATFDMVRNATTAAITIKDRLSFEGMWDVQGISPSDDNRAVIVAAVRTA